MVGMKPRRELPPTDMIFVNSPPSDDNMVSSSGVITSLGSVAVEEAAAAAALMVVLAAKVESADAWCRYNEEREERSDEFSRPQTRKATSTT